MMSGSERSRSRSRSPTLTNQSTNSKTSRRRSPSEKSYSDESFYSETSRKNAKGKKNKPPTKGPIKKGGKVNSKDSSRHNSTNGGMNARSNPVTVSRVMSANRLRIQELRNRVAELTDQCLVLQQENRDFKRMMIKQERKLNGYEQQENGMPRIMQRQADETQMLRDQLRRQKERGDKRDKKLKDKEDELEAMRRLVKKMQGLVEDKKLMERKKLSAKLKETEDRLNEEVERNKTLERHVQNLAKNHKHQMVTERTKEQELEQQIAKLQEKYDKLEVDRKEKEKERNLQNIYSYRTMRPPHRLDSSVHSSSQSDLVRASKPRDRARLERRRVGGSGDLTGRTEDYSPKKSERKYEDSSMQFSHGDAYGYRESQASVYKAEEKRDKERDTPRDKEADTARGRDRQRELGAEEDPLSWLREERNREKEQERRSWLEAKEREDAKKEEEERRRRDEERRREDARRREEERQRKQEEEEEKRKEQEQKRRTEHYQQPTRHQHQEQNHFDDRNNNKNDPGIQKKVDKDDEEDRLMKEDLLAKLRAIDEGKHDRTSSSNRKEYNFTEPVNNLHQGLPAHGQRKSNIFGDESPTFGSYQPSFVISDSKMTKRRDSRASNKPGIAIKNEKSDLFAELFVTEPKRASNVLTDARQDSPVLLELGGSTTKAKQHPTQLNREKQTIGPVFRSTTKKIEFSDEEIEELAIK